jgi:uncharacterized protein
MEHQSFQLKVKSVAADGSFVGLGAAYNNLDQVGDIIRPGAFARTLAAGKQFPLLWQHDPGQPIGSAKVSDSSAGLAVEGSLLLSDPTAKKAYEFLKAGIIRGLSIGFQTIQADYTGDARELTEIKLFELSIVTFAANESAQVTSVKAMSDDDRAAHFKKIDSHRKAIDRHQRGIRESLKSLFDGLDDDDSDVTGDPALLEGEGDDYGEMAMVLQELKALAVQAEELATA